MLKKFKIKLFKTIFYSKQKKISRNMYPEMLRFQNKSLKDVIKKILFLNKIIIK